MIPSTSPSILLLSPLIFFSSPFTSAQQPLTQHQICTSACLAANACTTQCLPSAGADAYESCLCQSGCLCNAEICLQCCAVTGNNVTVLPGCATTSQLAAGNVISFCGIGALTPGRSCFVYGSDGTGNATSSYASDSPFPTSVEDFISSLFPLTNVTVSLSSQTAAKAATTSHSSQAAPNTGATSASSLVTSSSASTTGQHSASPPTSAAERIPPIVAKGAILLLALLL